MKNIVTRIAPSPTGTLHVGTARSALFNYLFAKKHGGKFIVRIEDTDKERSTKEFEDDILSGLERLGLAHDALYRQSERGAVYAPHIQKLLDSDTAYLSKEPSKADPTKEVEVVRLRNPGKEITFTDLVRGDITFDTTELGDFVIARSIDEPLYHLVVVIDDYEMGISHVIRGEDHISNTPRQILIQEALGIERPQYAHMPLILAPDRSKLSKRHGAVSITEYLKSYQPEALINYLALLGWNPGTEQEIFTLDELVEAFSIEKIQKGGAIFSTEKLDDISHEHLKKLSKEEFALLIEHNLPSDIGEKIKDAFVSVVQERAKNLSQAESMLTSGELAFYTVRPEVLAENICFKDDDRATTKKHLEKAIELFTAIEGDFSADDIKNSIWEYATESGRGSVLWPIRYTLSGQEKSPDPFSIAEALGKEETIARLQQAITSL